MRGVRKFARVGEDLTGKALPVMSGKTCVPRCDPVVGRLPGGSADRNVFPRPAIAKRKEKIEEARRRGGIPYTPFSAVTPLRAT